MNSIRNHAIFLVVSISSGLIVVPQELNASGVSIPGLSQQEHLKTQPKSRVLVNPDWLAAHLNEKDVVLIGLGQKREQYEAAHIPGELFVDWRKEITDPEDPDRFSLPPQAQLEALLGRLGISPQTTIVVSDNFNSRLSARMFWTLRYFGHENVKLLDGGRKAWVQSGRSFVKEVPVPKPTAYKVSKIHSNHHADISAVRTQLANSQAKIVDGRLPDQFSGEKPGKAYHTGKQHQRRGHIASACNVPWPDNFNKDGTFKSLDELRKLYAQAGVNKEKDIITYCNEGLHAAPPWFVLTELLGYSDVRLYDDSMVEWANRSDTPMETSGTHNN